MPAGAPVPSPKKSNKLLLVMRFPVLMVLALVVVPLASIALKGKVAPAGPILLLEIVLLLLPTLVVVPKKIVPPACVTTTVDDPKMVEFVIILP